MQMEKPVLYLQYTSLYLLTMGIILLNQLVELNRHFTDKCTFLIIAIHLFIYLYRYVLSCEDPSVAPSSLSFTIIDRLHNVGRGAPNSFKTSFDMRTLSIASEDGNVYLAAIDKAIYSIPVQPSGASKVPFLRILGGMKCYASNVPVAAADFSTCGQFIRAYGVSDCGDRCVNVDFFDITPPAPPKTAEEKAILAKTPITSSTMIGRKILEPMELEKIRDNVKWASLGSPAVVCR
jgi:hypothetical protein